MTSTKKSAAPANLNEAARSAPGSTDFLDLPIEPGFRSIVPRGDLKTVLDLSCSYLPQLKRKPNYHRARAQDGCLEEFNLEHPDQFKPTYPVALVDDLLKLLNRST